MKKCVFTGVATALVTPFNQDLSINYGMLEKLIEFQIKGGVDALVLCGTTGESATLSDKEKLELFSFAKKIIGNRLPLIAGTGSNCTARVIELSKRTEETGADALLVVTPYYNKTSQAGLINHYYKIADSTSLPIIVYNVPSRTGMDILPQTYKELLKHKNIIAIKEASSNIVNLTETFSLCDDACIYSGADELILPMLALGGMGVISVISNIIPQQISLMCKYFFEGNIEKSRQIQLESMNIIKAIFSDVNPMPVKAALEIMGYDVGPSRPPLYKISSANYEKIKLLIQNV